MIFHHASGMALLLLAGLLSSQARAETLMEVYRFAQENDPQLQAAYANLQAVGENKSQTLAALLPSVSASANTFGNQEDRDSSSSLVTSNGISRFNSNGYSVNVTQPVYRKDRLERHSQVDAIVSEAEYQVGAAEQDLIVRVAQRYTDILTAIDTLQFRIAEREAIGRQLEQGKQRFEVGLIAITPVLELQAAYDLAVADELSAQNQLDNAYSSMREIIGRELTPLRQMVGKIPLFSPSPAKMDDWINLAVENNPALNAARSATERSRSEVQVQRAGHYPNVDVVASYSYSKSGGGTFGASSTRDASIGLQVSVPLFEGGGTQSRIRQAEYRRTQTMEGERQQLRSVTRFTQESYRGVATSISRAKALKQAVVSAKSAVEAAQAGLEVGTRTIVDVLDEQQKLYGARRNYSSERYLYIVSRLRLRQNAGTLAEEDLSDVSNWLNSASPSQPALAPEDVDTAFKDEIETQSIQP